MSRCPASAVSTRTAGSHTNGGSATQTFRRSMPNQWNIGIDAMAITRMLTSSSVPSTFHAAMHPPRHPEPRQRECEHDGGRPRDDVEAAAGVTHLHRHDAFDIRPVHQQLQRQPEALKTHQRHPRRVPHDEIADPRKREPPRQREHRGHEQQHRGRPPFEVAQHAAGRHPQRDRQPCDGAERQADLQSVRLAPRDSPRLPPPAR